MKIITPVKLGDKKNPYLLYINLENANELIYGKFTSWDRDLKKATEIEIITNTVPNFEITEIETLKKRKCNNNEKCNEFQLKAKHGISTPVGKKFKINPPCDFSKNQVVILQFSDKERLEGLHKKKLCLDCYFYDGIIPETSKGNIIVGGD
ncbi:hypothetical protein [Tenacibaculum agarivorans]|uniref:hypothetical protein n=1 Tax=Tenacibaculum agarivorans TaxID=1908389 RepID=UPI000A9F3100|nr:hypothetical protein [Tenacibaculum agarivorans]